MGSYCLHQTHRRLGVQALSVVGRAGDVLQGDGGEAGRGQLGHEVGQVLFCVENFRSHLVLRFPVSQKLSLYNCINGFSPAQNVGRVDRHARIVPLTWLLVQVLVLSLELLNW